MYKRRHTVLRGIPYGDSSQMASFYMSNFSRMAGGGSDNSDVPWNPNAHAPVSQYSPPVVVAPTAPAPVVSTQPRTGTTPIQTFSTPAATPSPGPTNTSSFPLTPPASPLSLSGALGYLTTSYYGFPLWGWLVGGMAALSIFGGGGSRRGRW